MIDKPGHSSNESSDMAAERQVRRETAGKRRMVRGIMLAVIVWGGFLASGLWLSTHNWRGPAFVMACVFAFLGFWAWLLATRAGHQPKP